MVKTIQTYWWLIAFRGIFTFLFGIAIIAWPGLTVIVLLTIFALYSIISGAASGIVGLLSIGKDQNWWVFILEGIVGILIGVFLLSWPGMTAILLLYFVGAWALISGLLAIFSGFLVGQEKEKEWMLIVSGLISLVFGFVILFWPGASLIALLWLVGAYAIIAGIFTLAFAFSLRKV